MNLLLDTHVFLWFIAGDQRLPENIVEKIIDPANTCYVSFASIWEIAIKLSQDKITIKGGFQPIEDFLSSNDIAVLDLNISHSRQLLSLEHLHEDPFDRMIISQAMDENMVIITKDPVFKDYNVKVMW